MAGILLGPSLFGLLAPNAFQFIFAASSLDALRLFSQIGVCLFLFTVGMELDVSEVRHKAQTAVVVSHSSIVIPYFLGVTLALFLYQPPRATWGLVSCLCSIHGDLHEHHRFPCAGSHLARPRHF